MKDKERFHRVRETRKMLAALRDRYHEIASIIGQAHDDIEWLLNITRMAQNRIEQLESSPGIASPAALRRHAPPVPQYQPNKRLDEDERRHIGRVLSEVLDGLGINIEEPVEEPTNGNHIETGYSILNNKERP